MRSIVHPGMLAPHLQERLYISLLSSRKEKVEFQIVSRVTGISCEEIKSYLEKLSNVRTSNEAVLLDDLTWVSLAEHAVRKGLALGTIAKAISWQRFEALTEEALLRHGFETRRNLRFSSRGRRWEMDVLGLREGDLICFDCKQWKTPGKASALKKSAEEQLKRIAAFSQLEAKPRMSRGRWDNVRIYAALTTLLDTNRYVTCGCFIVPISKLNSFLEKFYELRELVRPVRARVHSSLLEFL